MEARDIMTSNVVTTTPTATVMEVARLLVEHRISAIPVVDDGEKLLGIVSEQDLVRRPEIAGERQPPWWLGLLSDPAERAKDYVKTHSQSVGEIMTKDVVTVNETTTIAEIAHLLEAHRIKRTPVVQEGVLVGIVSRADLVRVLVAQQPVAEATDQVDDDTIQAQLQKVLDEHGWDSPYMNVIVEDGVVHLTGVADTPEARQALRVAAEGIPGVKVVEEHFAKSTGWA